jgi:hydroxyacyl-ACP dehydratase HTD2-like protein with hotdog domain
LPITPYCRDEEGYPGLVVHGPLLALLMLELPRRHTPERQVRTLSYRLRRPVFAGEHLVACGAPSGQGAELRIATQREARHATAQVTFA